MIKPSAGRGFAPTVPNVTERGSEMAAALRSKRVSYGIVEVVDHGVSSIRYSIRVNGQIREQSNDLNFIVRTFDSKYY